MFLLMFLFLFETRKRRRSSDIVNHDKRIFFRSFYNFWKSSNQVDFLGGIQKKVSGKSL